MATINAYKMDGLGNDFLIIDRRKLSVNLSKKQIIDFSLLSIMINLLPRPSILKALIKGIIID